MEKINLVSLLLIIVFLIPVIAGALKGFSRERVYSSVCSIFRYVLLLIGLFASIYLARNIFIEKKAGFFAYLYSIFPADFRTYLDGRDVMVYLLIVPLFLSVISMFLKLVTIPLYKCIIYPLSEKSYTSLNKIGNVSKKIIGALSNIPKGIAAVFIFSLLLSFYTYYYPTPLLGKWMNESKAYNLLYKNAIYPMLNSSIAKGIPVLLNDSFGKLNDQGHYGTGGRNGESIPEQLIDSLKGNTQVIEYFNGVTIDEAIKSDSEIDAKARQLVFNAKTERDKAYKIYKWISSNIKYDYDKVKKLGNEPEGISSGSMIAFKTRKGICFDFSSLFVSMCRAVGLKVQLITGSGYSGVSWGDHAWNRVFLSDENKWVNVDATFGTIANYFDRRNFGVDHTNAEIQGEWPSA